MGRYNPADDVDSDAMWDMKLMQEVKECEIQGFHNETGRWVVIAKSSKPCDILQKQLRDFSLTTMSTAPVFDFIEGVAVRLDHFSMLRAV